MESTSTFSVRKNKSFQTTYILLFFFSIMSRNVFGQFSVSADFANNNGSSVVIFTFYNGNAYPININSIGTYAGTTGTQTAQFWIKSVSGFGQATNAAVNATNGWTLQATQSITTTANTTSSVGATAPLVLSGMNVSVPSNSYYLFCVSLSSSIRYSTLGAQTGTFTSNGCDINCTANNGFGGTLVSPSNTPRGFIGVINFSPAYIPTSRDLGVSAFLQPLGSKICYTTDTIVARLKNFGTNTIDFTANNATVTAVCTGPNPGTFNLALTSGTLASGATKDFTLSTNYNLTNIGTYKLKGFATIVGDGSAVNDTTIFSVTKNPAFSTSSSPNSSVCLGIPVQLNANFNSTKQVGTGVIENTSTTYPTPFGNYYEGAKHQFLLLASELTSAGLVAGNFNSMSFYVTNLNGTNPLTNYNVAIATTTLTNIIAFQTTGFTSYYSSASYIPVLGINTHVFSTPYIWDGISNIIIETCFNNTPAGFSSNVSVLQSNTPFTSSVWHNADATPSLCSQTTISSSMSQRPNIGFEQPSIITYTWSPAIELSAANISNPIANVTSTRTYTIASNTSGCMTYDTIQIIIKPTPTPNLGNDTLYCTQPVVTLNANTAANNFLWNTGAIGPNINITNSGKYWVSATNSNGCSNTDTIQIGLGASPIVTLGPDTAFCQGSSIHLYAGTGIGNVYAWTTGATTSSITVNAPGTYSVLVTDTVGCQSSDIVSVISKAKPNVSLVFTGSTSFCKDDNTTKVLFEGSPSGGTYIGAAVTGNTFTANQAGQGSHIILYTITGSNGCSNTAKDTLTVNACVGIEELSNDMNLNVYPNPTTGIFTLDLTTNSDLKGAIYLTSIDGKVVLNDVIEGNGLISKSIDISHISNGIYYLKLETKDAIKTYKVLKQ